MTKYRKVDYSKMDWSKLSIDNILPKEEADLLNNELNRSDIACYGKSEDRLRTIWMHFNELEIKEVKFKHSNKSCNMYVPNKEQLALIKIAEKYTKEFLKKSNEMISKLPTEE